MTSRSLSNDLEAGDTQKSEKCFLLPERRTSSLDDETPQPPLGISRAHSRANPAIASRTSMSRAQSRTLPSKSKGVLQVSTDATQDSAEDQQESKSKRMKGLGLAGVATVFQAVMSVCAKILGRSGIPVFEILLVRGIMILSISYMKAVTATQHTFPYALGQRKWLLLLRGCLGFGAVSSLYGALQYLPLSDALVLTFLSPLVVAALSPVFNKELPSLMVVGAMVISLGGVAMIAQPSFLFGGRGINKLGLGLAIMQAGFSACARICVRELRKTETTDIIMVYSGTVHCLFAIIACITVPRSIVILQHTWQVLTLLATGLCAYGGQVCLTSALRLVEASPATAMSYLTVVWGLILGFFIFQEVPGVWDSCGAAVVCATTMLLGWEEKRQGDKQQAQHTQQSQSVESDGDEKETGSDRS
ncbi:hypothetical protein ABBQ38_012341 [Trebouxia sp. C0009 RCD-2024]